MSRHVSKLIEPGDTVTLTNFVAGSFNNTKTLFKELVTNSPAFKLSFSSVSKDTRQNFISNFIKLFEESIFSTWDPKKTHIIFHSSGYDSRILSKIICNLANKYGSSWLGTVYFLCYSPEHKEFIDIMKYLGFNESQYILYNQDHISNITFENIWRNVNGAACYPDNAAKVSTDYVSDLKNIVIDNNIQIYSAGFFNEVFDRKGFTNQTSLIAWLKKYYYSRYSQFISAVLAPIMYPLLDLNILTFIANSGVKLSKGLRLQILENLDNNLYSLPKTPDPLLRINRNKDVTSIWQKHLLDIYNNSWYAKKTGIRGFTEHNVMIDSSPFWSHFTAASWCNYLHNIDVTIL